MGKKMLLGNPGASKLTREQVIFLRGSSLPNSSFARMWGLNVETIRRARKGENFAWVKERLPVIDTAEAMLAEFEGKEGMKHQASCLHDWMVWEGKKIACKLCSKGWVEGEENS